MATKVMFRRFSDGQVIALFPEEPSDCINWYNCTSYVLVGGHCGANPLRVVRATRPAKALEAEETLEVLREHYGYKDIVQVRRISRTMTERRREEWRKARWGGSASS